MDRELFTCQYSGELVSISEQTGKCAFVPAKLPAHWEFPNKLWPLVVSAKEKLGTLNGIGQTLPDAELLLRPLQNREALTSSSLEGTFVTPQQLLLYELDQREPKSRNDKVSAWREVFNYSQSLKIGCQQLRTLPICLRVIKSMHKALMEGTFHRNVSPGEFRRWQVQIGSMARFIPPPSNVVDDLMNNLEEYINQKHEMDSLVRCFLIHYQFEAIHPFGDGNGRVGRALLALMIYKWLDHTRPWLYMSAYFERYKEEYIRNLFQVSTEGDFSTWIEFCLNGVISQADDAILRCTKFKELKEEFHQKMDTASPRTHPIIDMIFASPLLTAPVIQEKFNVAHRTARTDLEKLTEAGILSVLEGSRPLTYFSPRVMEISFADRIDGD